MKIKTPITLKKSGLLFQCGASNYEKIDIVFANSIFVGTIVGHSVKSCKGPVINSPNGVAGAVLQITAPLGCVEADVSAAFSNLAQDELAVEEDGSN